jgi:hypothetical protein
MGKKKKTARRRCASCRKWFRPQRSADQTQRTCSAECRQKRLRSLARRRRERDLAKHREQERRRQQACRERRRGKRPRSPDVDQEAASVTSASRSPLSAQIIAVERVFLATWDKRMWASRAGLVADLRTALRKIEPIVGQAGTAEAAGHAPSPNG